MTDQSNSAAERSAHVHRGDAPSPADWPVVRMPDGTWKLKSIVPLENRIAELKAEVRMWRDENFKKQTAYQRRGVRIAELEVALHAVNWRLLQTYEFGKCRSECLRIIDDALTGGEDE